MSICPVIRPSFNITTFYNKVLLCTSLGYNYIAQAAVVSQTNDKTIFAEFPKWRLMRYFVLKNKQNCSQLLNQNNWLDSLRKLKIECSILTLNLTEHIYPCMIHEMKNERDINCHSTRSREHWTKILYHFNKNQI